VCDTEEKVLPEVGLVSLETGFRQSIPLRMDFLTMSSFGEQCQGGCRRFLVELARAAGRGRLFLVQLTKNSAPFFEEIYAGLAYAGSLIGQTLSIPFTIAFVF
jgi:hypothetical protein